MAGLGQPLKVYASTENYIEDTLFPAASTPVSSRILKTGEGGENGSLEIIMSIKEAITIPEDTTILLEVLSGNASDGSDSTVFHTARKHFGDGADEDCIAGQVLMRTIIPSDAKKYTSLTIIPDNAIVGKFDVILGYIPR